MVDISSEFKHNKPIFFKDASSVKNLCKAQTGLKRKMLDNLPEAGDPEMHNSTWKKKRTTNSGSQEAEQLHLDVQSVCLSNG